MNSSERKSTATELRKILETMELPSFRTQYMSEHNLRWLQRNILFKNEQHPEIEKALSIIGEMLKQYNP
jgi:hypothetical protein